jgi:hypothetical protein
MNDTQPPEPWFSFLNEIDDHLTEETHLHCLGGFVVIVIYGADRLTVDLDALSLRTQKLCPLGLCGQRL